MEELKVQVTGLNINLEIQNLSLVVVCNSLNAAMEVDYRQLPWPEITKEKSDKAELYHVLGLKEEEG